MAKVARDNKDGLLILEQRQQQPCVFVILVVGYLPDHERNQLHFFSSVLEAFLDIWQVQLQAVLVLFVLELYPLN